MSTPQILQSSPLAEQILESHRRHAHGDDAGYDGYKAHVNRRINFARALTPDDGDRDDKLAIGSAFHDLADFDTIEDPVLDLVLVLGQPSTPTRSSIE
jgi:hypothetical protein